MMLLLSGHFFKRQNYNDIYSSGHKIKSTNGVKRNFRLMLFIIFKTTHISYYHLFTSREHTIDVNMSSFTLNFLHAVEYQRFFEDSLNSRWHTMDKIFAIVCCDFCRPNLYENSF